MQFSRTCKSDRPTYQSKVKNTMVAHHQNHHRSIWFLRVYMTVHCSPFPRSDLQTTCLRFSCLQSVGLGMASAWIRRTPDKAGLSCLTGNIPVVLVFEHDLFQCCWTQSAQ